ncbi:hypothetical protein NPIL_409381 [Nephila pilipes]|uniref:Uncharacterized protein n=1 Tax=Nephila pilipes TaxID=299642 RepID=A0A8X6KDS8_NEPPI|nr:hypothetical protein NPIL_409381 [Nephila pilipes]
MLMCITKFVALPVDLQTKRLVARPDRSTDDSAMLPNLRLTHKKLSPFSQVTKRLVARPDRSTDDSAMLPNLRLTHKKLSPFSQVV